MTKLIEQLRNIADQASIDLAKKREQEFFKFVDVNIKKAASLGKYEISFRVPEVRADMNQTLLYLKKEGFNYKIEHISDDYSDYYALYVSWKQESEKKSFWSW